MSRIVRRQLFEMMDTLQTATNMLEGLFAYDSGEVSYEELVELLADCQNCAITVGNKIETVYGEGTKSVAMLEAYCESIYGVAQSLEQPTASLQHYNNAKERLSMVLSHMEQDIPDKKEIVFLPYKASMWDSLESVYLAVREDEECEAYVVPIPYFDRKQDKSLGQMHYEGNEYPVNIPVTDWEQYSIEERCPDVIYIHNAYDDMNLVTCVHPKFFSSNIKNYTDELIYIPYFVLEEIEPDDQAKIDNIKHFCVLPGIINADKVILQSEKMSQIYINEYAKAFEAAGASVDREQLKQKFLGLGSPKFDKVLNTKKEDVEIPAEWLKVIQRPDGTWKKIIFYNTSVTALLKHEEKMLHKMKNVFEVFKERQDEVALLWRPHPLIKTTIEAMRPQLWQEYEQIVEQYKAEGWGIYDDTADMDRAIALSDGYYGDQSSVIQLCQKAGVPVMVQNVEMVNISGCKELINKRTLIAGAVIKDCDKIWISSMAFNALYCHDINKNKTHFVAKFPMEEAGEWKLHGDAVKCGDEIYFLPDRSSYIHVFNIVSGKLESYDMHVKGRVSCSKAVCVDRKIYFASVVQGLSIFSIDIETKCIEQTSIGNGTTEISKDIISTDNNVYIASKNKSVLIEFSIKSKRFREYEISEGSNGFGTLSFDGSFFWLSDTEKILKVNLQKKEVCIYKDFPKGYGMTLKNGDELIYINGFTNMYNELEKPFYNSAIIGNKLLLLPCRINMIIEVNLEDGKMKQLRLKGERENRESLFTGYRLTHCHYLGGKQGCEIVFTSSKTKRTYVIDSKENRQELKHYSFWAEEPCDLGIYVYGTKFYEEELDKSIVDFIGR